MSAASLNQLLMLYTWFLLTGLLLFLLLIARFYQKFSGNRTYFRIYILSVVLFGGGSIRYASIQQVFGDWVGDLLFAFGGAVLIVLSLMLYRHMLSGKS